jgi:hypothetical protein
MVGIMTTSTPRPKSFSKRVLRSVGLAYVPELTRDTTGQTKVSIPSYISHLLADKKLSNVVLAEAPTPTPELEQVVANLAIKEKPSPAGEKEKGIVDKPEYRLTTSAVHELNVALPPSASGGTLLTHGPRSCSSDSSSTLNDTIKVSFTEYINSTCPHIAEPYFAKPLLLPTMSLEEVAGFKGWFTKSKFPDFKWER